MADRLEMTRDRRRSKSRLDRNNRLERGGAILLVVAATLAMLFTGLFEPVEHQLTTVRAQLLDRPPTGQVAIVEIDAKSLAKISTWPWSRRYHAQVLDRLHGSKAAIVAFDVDFSSSSDSDGDATFAKALNRSGLTILPVFQQSPSDQPSQTLIRTEPAKLFSTAWVGGVNILPDAVGVVRDYPAATMIGGQIRPSMAVLLAENDDLADRAFQPDWAINAREIPRYSFVDVIEGRVPHKAFAGKRVIVGATAIELGDRYTIPRFGAVPGVVLQALAADSLLQARALTRSGILPTLLGIALAAVALGLSLHRRFWCAVPLQGAATLAILLAIPVAVEAHWPTSVDSAAALFCALGCIAARVGVETRRRHRESTLFDAETALPNARSLEAVLGDRAGSPTVLAAAGIDRFESIRNAISTDALADLVREVAKRIEIASGEPVYRIAPDVLAWIEARSTDDEGYRPTDVATMSAEPVLTRDGPVDVHLTIGLDDDPLAQNVRSKIERSVAGITMARAAGEACHWYRSIDPNVRRQLSLMGELRRGMKRGEVRVFYQPKLDIERGTIANAEALVRWQHPREGAIAPDLFIPLAESTGVVRELTDYVLSRALADCGFLRASGKKFRVAVNVSAADVCRRDFANEIRELIAKAGADPAWLTLEVTESAILSSPQNAIESLTALREMGARLSVDDYGTGQSTLSYLKRFPVTELKIDKSFVTTMCDNEPDRIMVKSTIELAHQLGIEVVAEGVEDQRTLAALRALGCDYAQGYFIGKAMPLDRLVAIDRCAGLSKVA